MIVPADVMRILMNLEHAAIRAAEERDKAVQLVLATLGAEYGAQIVLLPDGCGEVVAIKSPPVGGDTAG